MTSLNERFLVKYSALLERTMSLKCNNRLINSLKQLWSYGTSTFILLQLLRLQHLIATTGLECYLVSMCFTTKVLFLISRLSKNPQVPKKQLDLFSFSTKIKFGFITLSDITLNVFLLCWQPWVHEKAKLFLSRAWKGTEKQQPFE